MSKQKRDRKSYLKKSRSKTEDLSIDLVTDDDLNNSTSPQLSETCKQLVSLFKNLYSINIPTPTPTQKLDRTQNSKTFRHRTKTFFSSNTELNDNEQIIPQPNNSESFLTKMKSFFRKEKRFWVEYYKSIDKKSEIAHIKKLRKSNFRPWAFISNYYISETTKDPNFYDYLNNSRVKIFSSLLERFISLELEKSNAENTISSLPVIERAKSLLLFLQIHCIDPYSCVIGLQATHSVISSCVQNASPVNNSITIDLSKYLLELTTIRNDKEVASNVRTIAAKIRGIGTIKKGDVVLLILPSAEEAIQLPNTIKDGKIVYEPKRSIFNVSFTKEKSGSIRAIYARCAVTPTNDNWMGLWTDTKEITNNIVWVNISRVYLLQSSYKEWLSQPIKEYKNISTLVEDRRVKLEEQLKAITHKLIIKYLQTKLDLNDDTFQRITRSKTKYTDEYHMIQFSQLVSDLLSNTEFIEKMDLITNIHNERDNILENINKYSLFALEREDILSSIKTLGKDDFLIMIVSVIKELQYKCQSRMKFLESAREKILNGSKKNHITSWWLKEVRNTVQAYLTKLGYLYDAVPKNYTNTPPDNVSLVKQNLTLVVTVLTKDTKENNGLLKEIKGLKKRIYPCINELTYDLRCVLLHILKLPVTEESVEQFDIQSVSEEFDKIKNTLDDDLARQVSEMIKDLEYLTMMQILETDDSQRAYHPHIVPISGLVKSSIVRLETECRTVIELWPSQRPKRACTNESEILTNLGISSLTTKDKHQRTPFHVFCRPGGEIDTAIILVGLRETKVNTLDENNEIPLHGLAQVKVSSNEEQEKIISLAEKMIDLHVKINQQNNKGETPLHLAIMHDNEALASLLIEAKANITLEDCNGDNIIKCLQKHPSETIAETIFGVHKIEPDTIASCGKKIRGTMAPRVKQEDLFDDAELELLD